MLSPGFFLTALAVLLATLAAWRQWDRRREEAVWRRLIALHAGTRQVFQAAMVDGLPEPAQRYFHYTIKVGTPLAPVVDVDMAGDIGLGTQEAPKYRPLQARQILASPHGFLWSMTSGAISGSDGALPGKSWTRFWLWNLIPVARATGPDHLRSSFGRLVADAVLWAPASLLPGNGVSWEALGEDCARVTVRHGLLEQAVDVHVNAEGAPVRVLFQRWSDANPQRHYQLQPFGGELSEFREFAGYRLPTCVIAGNHYGTAAYFPFFKVRVSAIRFPDAPPT
jgi:hypothetical protein